MRVSIENVKRIVEIADQHGIVEMPEWVFGVDIATETDETIFDLIAGAILNEAFGPLTR